MITDEQLEEVERFAGSQRYASVEKVIDRTRLITAVLMLVVELRQLRADRERVLLMLKDLECAPYQGGWEHCEVCSAWMDASHPSPGHADDCKLAPIIAALQAAGGPGNHHAK